MPVLGVRKHNRSLSRGGGGGGNNIEACPEGTYKSVPGRWRYNVSLFRGAFIYCPSGGGGGGGGTFGICRGVWLNNGIAQHSPVNCFKPKHGLFSFDSPTRSMNITHSVWLYLIAKSLAVSPCRVLASCTAPSATSSFRQGRRPHTAPQ